MLGFHRLACCVPPLRVADPVYNAARIREQYLAAAENGAEIALFPELCITGYTCGDLFAHRALQDGALAALASLASVTTGRACLLVVGLPIAVGPRLFNAAAVLGGGRVLGFPLKEYLPNFREFYEKRQFRAAHEFTGTSLPFGGIDVPAGRGLVFECGTGDAAVRFGVELCEDLWTVLPPSSTLALGGAQIILNLSAGDELVAKADFRRKLVDSQSARLSCTYALAGAGVHESTADMVFSGHSLISFNGTRVAENERFERKGSIVYADVNPSWTDALRHNETSFCEAPVEATAGIRTVSLPALPGSPDLAYFKPSPRPFVPANETEREERAREIFAIQAAGLAKRLEHVHAKRLVIGISGGLDSTLALLACTHVTALLGLPRDFTLAVTMPGFGTTSRTRTNAVKLARELGVELRTVQIAAAVRRHFADIGHDENVHDVTYENCQARERTQILMDLANKEGGLLVGTGDLSEIALGWSTFNGDHMSMYNVNCGIPKTLIRYLVESDARRAPNRLAYLLRDVNDTPVSPELVPGGAATQKTEDILGRYELHDFFLYWFIKFGATAPQLRALARRAFDESVSDEQIENALAVFFRRFASQQFKRNACPDGPKVGTVALSPRGDWRCPPDFTAAVFGY